MRAYGCIVADDEVLIRNRVAKFAADEGLDVLGTAGSGREAVSLIESLRPDIAFLDIRMPQMTGLEVMERLAEMERPPAVVLVTAFDAHAVAAFELSAIDYLLKPIGRERFARAVSRARDAVDSRNAAESLSRLRDVVRDGRPERLSLRDGGRIVSLAPSAVVRVQGRDDYAEIHADGRSHLVGVQLSALETALPSPPFIRVHRSHLVNADHVETVRPGADGGHVALMSDGAEVKISRGRAKAVMDALAGSGRKR